jgi:hypothetical protein
MEAIAREGLRVCDLRLGAGDSSGLEGRDCSLLVCNRLSKSLNFDRVSLRKGFEMAMRSSMFLSKALETSAGASGLSSIWEGGEEL